MDSDIKAILTAPGSDAGMRRQIEKVEQLFASSNDARDRFRLIRVSNALRLRIAETSWAAPTQSDLFGLMMHLRIATVKNAQLGLAPAGHYRHLTTARLGFSSHAYHAVVYPWWSVVSKSFRPHTIIKGPK